MYTCNILRNAEKYIIVLCMKKISEAGRPCSTKVKQQKSSHNKTAKISRARREPTLRYYVDLLRNNAPKKHHTKSERVTMTSQPSEVQTIFNDALTDLKALVDHLLPVASEEGVGFAGRMTAPIGKVGEKATKVNSPLATSSESSPITSCKTGVASPQCSASEHSNLQCCEISALQCCASEYSSSFDGDDNEAMDESTYGSSSEGSTPTASVPRVVVPATTSSTSNRCQSTIKLVDQTMDTLDTILDTTLDATESFDSFPVEEESGKVEMKIVIDEAKLKSSKPLLESPTRKAEREADEAARSIAHRTYHLGKSSPSQPAQPGQGEPSNDSDSDSDSDSTGMDEFRSMIASDLD